MIYNRSDKTIQFKIVYHGPGLCGKTTNLQQIFTRVRPDQKLSQSIMEIPTQEDKTLSFDLMPLSIGSIKGYTATFSFYTVPGQVHYQTSRKLILEDVDGVVFVADSQRQLRNENIRMLEELKKTVNNPELPLVFQFNKRDLPDIMDIETMKEDLLEEGEPYYEAVAIKGIGIMETYQTIVNLTVSNNYS